MKPSVHPNFKSPLSQTAPRAASFIPDDFEYDPFDPSSQSDEAVVAESETHIVPPIPEATFSEVLDFSFPEEVEGGIAQVGEVIYIGDGVCKVTGLPGAKIDDVIHIKTERGLERALILGLQETHLESVVMGDYTKIKQGDPVIATNSRLKVPAGEGVLGRIINPLGDPIDGKGRIKVSEHRDVEYPAPPVMDRASIFEQLRTGVMAIDTTIPIGKGQRELVIGDRKTGKSRTVVDIISNQKGQNVLCVYVGVGIQAAKAKSTYQLLLDRGAMKYTSIVIATSDDPPSLQYIAPYVGAALAEYFMYRGRHVLICFDDLSKQAKAYRQVSLLLKRSPGRDAYPGDIFFLHSRLLERASKLHPKLGGGSITALPIAETQSGDVSDYIITNLMSITDGHIYLDANMMHEGILPAINSGTSVSRIGSKVQINLHKKMGELAGRALARYAEVKSFETINTEVSEDTLRDIRRGKRVNEIFAQESSVSYANDEQIVLMQLVVSGKLDQLELTQFVDFKRNFLKFYRETASDTFRQSFDAAKKIEEVAPEIDKLYDAFNLQAKAAEEAKWAKMLEEENAKMAAMMGMAPPATS